MVQLLLLNRAAQANYPHGMCGWQQGLFCVEFKGLNCVALFKLVCTGLERLFEFNIKFSAVNCGSPKRLRAIVIVQISLYAQPHVAFKLIALLLLHTSGHIK